MMKYRSRVEHYLHYVSKGSPKNYLNPPSDLQESLIAKPSGSHSQICCGDQLPDVWDGLVLCRRILGLQAVLLGASLLYVHFQIPPPSHKWDVVYCSNPTSPGGGYRSAIGRLVFSTNDMIQVVEAPDTVRNLVSFSALGFLDGEVSLKGKLKALDEKWIQVVFEPPQLKVGGLEFRYGGESEVKLEITYIDQNMRLGKGSRGSLFVFTRRLPTP